MSSDASKGQVVFIAIDGDRAGEVLERFLAQRDLVGAASFSNQVARFFIQLKKKLRAHGATVYFCEGDSLLASIPCAVFDPDVLRQFPAGPCTVSIGLAWDTRGALMALKMAKALGRDNIVSLLDNGLGQQIA